MLAKRLSVVADGQGFFSKTTYFNGVSVCQNIAAHFKSKWSFILCSVESTGCKGFFTSSSFDVIFVIKSTKYHTVVYHVRLNHAGINISFWLLMTQSCLERKHMLAKYGRLNKIRLLSVCFLYRCQKGKETKVRQTIKVLVLMGARVEELLQNVT